MNKDDKILCQTTQIMWGIVQKVHFGLLPALKMPPSKWPAGQKIRERRIFSKLRRCQFSIVTSYRKSERNCLYLFIDRIYQKYRCLWPVYIMWGLVVIYVSSRIGDQCVVVVLLSMDLQRLGIVEVGRGKVQCVDWIGWHWLAIHF